MTGTTRPYIVRQGDYLTKLAQTLGFDADSVWNDPRNDALRTARPDSEQLQPGDVLIVPNRLPRAHPVQSGTTNTYCVQVVNVPVEIVLTDGTTPLSGIAYRVEGLGAGIEGVTDANGTVKLEVPVHVREFHLALVERDLRFAVYVGDMDPIDESSGVVKRLDNLGYLDGNDESARTNAIAAFQRAEGLEESGVVNEATRAALTQAHRS